MHILLLCRDRISNLTEFKILLTELPIGHCVYRTSNPCVPLGWRNLDFRRQNFKFWLQLEVLLTLILNSVKNMKFSRTIYTKIFTLSSHTTEECVIIIALLTLQLSALTLRGCPRWEIDMLNKKQVNVGRYKKPV